MDKLKPLNNMLVVTLALNLPGPLAAKRLLGLGATVIKIEPPTGDPFEQYCPAWYREMKVGQQHQIIDLKSSEGQERLAELLSNADLLLTAQRPVALKRLGLDWETLHKNYPELNHVAIVGYPPPRENHAGHDLTYQATQGLINPPNMPRTLIADLTGGEQAIIESLTVLMGCKAGQKGAQRLVALADAVEYMALPVKYGLTTEAGLLGGALPEYSLYETKSGWVALAALEPHFRNRLQEKLQLQSLTKSTLTEAMKMRTAPEWASWANEHDIPLLELK
ncbi:MAG: CoA transferase [Gammaproteobacteria bacterium]|nr:MAG: CoA transferase [Gammaproteobacteria bacterium]